MSRPGALFLFGPTAVGKTEALETLIDRPVEVISADSMQVYRGMDIGTAKPDRSLRDRLPHHLIDIRNPDEQYDVGAFVCDANRAIEETIARGRLPVVAGGTGFYFRHLLYGLPQAPPSDPAIRERLLRETKSLGAPQMYRRLAEVDPAAAERIHPHDAYRVTRALEVHEQTGRGISDFAAAGPPRTDITVSLCALHRDRDELRQRISSRVRSMFEEGLRDEVERLVGLGYGPGDPGLRAIGYREFFGPAGRLRPAEEDERIAAQIIGSTRRYAKRQMTFFRRLPEVLYTPAAELSGLMELVDRLCDTVRPA